MRISRVMGPPGGWKFPVTPTVTLTALTPQLLHEAIHEFRVENGIPPGDIEADLDAHFCKHWPERCTPEPKDNRWPHGVTPEDKMSGRVLAWVTTMLDVRRMPQGGWPLVPLKEADARAKACAVCPRNRPWNSSCAGCDESVKRGSARVRSHRAPDPDGRLQACELFGWDNAAAFHLTEGALGITAEDPRRALTPAHCWLHPVPVTDRAKIPIAPG